MPETFLMIRARVGDTGTRPLRAPFASPDLSVGADGRPRATVWNLGRRAVDGVVTRFFTLLAGKPFHMEHLELLGEAAPVSIPPGGSALATCPVIWPRLHTADLLLAAVSHPDLAPPRPTLDPITDRHVAQMSYAWAGRYVGRLDGLADPKVALEIQPASRGFFRLRFFRAIEEYLPSHPQADRVMAPNGHTFRWLESPTGRKELYDLEIQDNERMLLRLRVRQTAEPEREATGLLERT